MEPAMPRKNLTNATAVKPRTKRSSTTGTGAQNGSAKEPRFELVKLDAVNPAPYNPRKDLQPGDPEFGKLAKSIAEFGCAQVLVFNERTGNLVGGHQTLKVLKYLGRSEAMMSIVDLPPEREKALNIALNKIKGDWDLQKLQELMEDLEALEDPALIELTGFEDGELERMLADLEGDPPDEDEDEAPAGAAAIGSSFEAVAVCNSEAEQQRAFDLLKENGFAAKVRTLY
jgi:ParB-like chromosome segregation protein Spo0J